MYLLLIDYGLEGWHIVEKETLEEIKINIMSGCTFGEPFKVAKEIPITFEDINDSK